MAQLLERLDDSFRLLVAGDRLAAARCRSLAATAEWSYRLLSEEEQRIFRRVSVFPAPFMLDGSEAVARAGAGAEVLRLAECSLLVLPRTGPGWPGPVPDAGYRARRWGRAGRLADAGERSGAAAALARCALQVTEQAAAGMQASAGELAAAAWLDAEDVTVHQCLAWALQHAPATALRLSMTLAPWWKLRGRMAAGYALLGAAAGHAVPGSDAVRRRAA